MANQPLLSFLGKNVALLLYKSVLPILSTAKQRSPGGREATFYFTPKQCGRFRLANPIFRSPPLPPSPPLITAFNYCVFALRLRVTQTYIHIYTSIYISLFLVRGGHSPASRILYHIRDRFRTRVRLKPSWSWSLSTFLNRSCGFLQINVYPCSKILTSNVCSGISMISILGFLLKVPLLSSSIMYTPSPSSRST